MEEPLLSQPTAAPKGGLDLDPEEPQHLYPAPFYCPLTQKVMEDPVVGADGDSFERSAALERDAAGDRDDAPRQTPRAYYPNRALQIAIEGEIRTAMERGTARGALRRAGEGLRAGLGAALGADDGRPLPGVYYCPITLDIMTRPAIDPDGNTYERRAIRSWIRRNGNSPLTREVMTTKQLRDNKALEAMLYVEVDRVADPNDPSILRWKESRKLIEDEENRHSRLLEEMEDYDSDDDGTGPGPLLPEEVGDAMSRGQCVFFFAVLFLLLSWSVSALVPLNIVPLNILIYVVMGLLIAFLNIVLIDQLAGRD